MCAVNDRETRLDLSACGGIEQRQPLATQLSLAGAFGNAQSVRRLGMTKAIDTD
jgi:hypothetical protein